MGLLGLLRDDFSTDTLAATWPASYGSAAVTGGFLVVPCTTSYAAGQTASGYTLNGSQASAEVTVCAQGGATVEAYTELLVLSGTGGTDLGLHYDAVTGLLSMVVRVGYVDADQLELTYDPLVHRWWRVRVESGVIFWDTSADGTTWTTHRTATAPAWATTGSTLALNLGARRNDGTPDNAYFDNVNVPPASTAMADLKVEISFGGASTSTLLTIDDPTRGLVGTGTLGTSTSVDPVWTDVTQWVRSGSTRRGASRADGPIYRYEAGTCSVTLLNTDRRFDPTNLSGPYVDGGVSQVTAMRGLRVSADWGGTTYQLFRGFIDNWDVSWSDPSFSEVTVTATDAFKIFAGIDRIAVTPVGASEDTGARITRILDDLGWDAADRIIATGDSTLQETDLSGDALSEMLTAVDSELGEIYVGGGGHVVFRNRTALLTQTRSNLPQAVFGDGGGYQLPYEDLGLSNDDSTFANSVIVTRDGGSPQTASDAASIVSYYKRVFSRDGVKLENDGDAANMAAWLLYTSKTPELRFDSIAMNPRTSGNDLWPQALGREIGDRIEILRQPPGGGSGIDRDVFIRGISHDFDPAKWKTTWTLQSAERYGSFFTLDNATLGRLDYNALAY